MRCCIVLQGISLELRTTLEVPREYREYSTWLFTIVFLSSLSRLLPCLWRRHHLVPVGASALLACLVSLAYFFFVAATVALLSVPAWRPSPRVAPAAGSPSVGHSSV